MKNRFRGYCRAAVATSMLAGCVNLAPPYAAPEQPTPANWASRGAANGAHEAIGEPPGYRVEWETFIADPRLRRVVARALSGNRDLRVALLSVEKARALYHAQRAALFPELDATADVARARATGVTSTTYTAGLQVSYELDLFGRVRNLSDSAFAQYLSTSENSRAAQVLLVSEVVTAWLTLAADEQRLSLSRSTLDTQSAALDLTTRIRDLGGTTGLAVAQVRTTVAAARVQVGAGKTQIALDRNALEILLGGELAEDEDPGELPGAATGVFDVPGNLPSTVLTHRPDVRATERALQATTFGIGAARAAFFPRIALTGAAGTSSTELSTLFRGGSGIFSIGPSIALPIFDGGLNRANLEGAVADQKIAQANYERAIQTAFREVADILAARRTLAERTAGQEALVDAAQTSFRLSDAVFRQGGSGYLPVLTAQQSLYAARQDLITLRLEEQSTRIALYKALGGGWGDGNADLATN
jgi:multidrug efflux system outer membrane protein